MLSRVTISVAHQSVALPSSGYQRLRSSAADNLVIQQALHPERRSLFGLQNEFVKARRAVELQTALPAGAERLGGVRGLGQVVLRQFANAFLSVHGEEDGRHQCHQRLVGADIRSRLLAPNVLFAGREREHKAAIAVVIGRLPDQPARHLPQVLFLGRDHSTERTAVAQRHAERLRLHADNIGLDWRPHHAQRNRLRNRHDQQRALGMRDLRNCRNILEDSKEIGALHQHGGRFVGYGGFEAVQIDAAGFCVVANRGCRHVPVAQIRAEYLTILRMHG